MADIVLPVVGGVAGFMLGGPQGAVLGANLGSMAATSFFSENTRVQLPTQEGPRLADLRAQTSTYGNMIPKIYGTMRVAGNIIWSTNIKEVRVEDKVLDDNRTLAEDLNSYIEKYNDDLKCYDRYS